MASAPKTSKAAKPAASTPTPPNTIGHDQRMATYPNIPPLTSRHPSLPQPITPKVSSPGSSTSASIVASSNNSDAEGDSSKVEGEEEEVDEDGSDKKYCYCESEGDGKMVGCDGAACQREWFHLSCLKMSRAPKGAWFCKECRMSS